MKRALLTRLENLEYQFRAEQPLLLQCGWLCAALPPDYVGERHYVRVKTDSTGSPNIFWCEYEERVGPAPADLSN